MKNKLGGFCLVIFLGLISFALSRLSGSFILEPLILALILGIITRSALPGAKALQPGVVLAAKLFIPLGIFFYALKNMNFVEIAKLSFGYNLLLAAVSLACLLVILACGRLFKQKDNISYLTAVGSAICGASAIVITSPAIDADSDDVSVSLLSVLVISFLSLFVILPFLATLFNLDNKLYAIFSGAVLQFTGFVKAANKDVFFVKNVLPQQEALTLALLVKSSRYLILLFALPLFASLKKKDMVFPWVFWLFLLTGVAGSFAYAQGWLFYRQALSSFIGPAHNIFWSIAMAAIGLNVDAKELLSNNGAKALLAAFIGFMAAVIIFFTGIYITNLFIP